MPSSDESTAATSHDDNNVWVGVQTDRSAEEMFLPPNEWVRGTAIHVELKWTPDQLDDVKRRYVFGEISVSELEAEIEDHYEDDETVSVIVRYDGDARRVELSRGDAISPDGFGFEVCWVRGAGSDSAGGIERQYLEGDLTEEEFEAELEEYYADAEGVDV